MRFTAFAIAAIADVVVANGGTPGDIIGDASRFSPQAYIEVSNVDDKNTCEYMLTFTYWHDPTLPTPDPDAETCDIKSIENIHDFSEKVKMYTPFDHASIDWNACGHIPEGESWADCVCLCCCIDILYM